MPFEWVVAVRFLREGRAQTILILLGIGVGVGVIVFLSALINGLQDSLIERTLGTQPHVILRMPDDAVRPMKKAGADELVMSRLEEPAQRLRSILRWQQTLDEAAGNPRVTAVAPLVSGAAFALRGNANKSIALRGIDPERYRAIIDLPARLIEGTYELAGDEALIGVELAKDFGLETGDKVRLTTAGGKSEVFLIKGVFDVGNKDLNERWVFVPIRAAQTLLDLTGGISSIEVKVREIFDAEDVAQELGRVTGLSAESWMKLNTQLLIGLRSQSASSVMIQVFVIVAVALGITSVLVVSVVQKSREIGILKAMGTTTGRVTRIFLLEGAILGLAGSALGLMIGSGLALFFASLAKNPDGSATFPVALTLVLFARSALVATTVGLLAAVIPARRAAQLDPAEVIRYG
ncbi:MAG: ABC transporter permease [Acidobacteria bacterium]|nr:ABC transporter permease [Acidobacteriota bacterium]MCG3193395.1 Lipoprotein-releasing system transmembrane protein LolE [Thermoanaerobaculia bacterium]